MHDGKKSYDGKRFESKYKKDFDTVFSPAFCVRSALCYGAESGPSRKKIERKLRITEIRMLQVICGKTFRDGINNETIHDMTGI